jgi:hypothetical protein
MGYIQKQTSHAKFKQHTIIPVLVSLVVQLLVVEQLKSYYSFFGSEKKIEGKDKKISLKNLQKLYNVSVQQVQLRIWDTKYSRKLNVRAF